jgi:hypothetical protein
VIDRPENMPAREPRLRERRTGGMKPHLGRDYDAVRARLERATEERFRFSAVFAARSNSSAASARTGQGGHALVPSTKAGADCRRQNQLERCPPSPWAS